jgi:hypothetical protein
VSDPGAWSRWGPPPEPARNQIEGRLAPRKVTELLAIGTRIVRRHWVPLLAIFALFGGVAIMLGEVAALNLQAQANTMISIDASGRGQYVGTDADTQRVFVALGWSLAASALLTISLAVASVAAAAYTDADYRGRASSFGAAVRLALRRSPVAIAVAILNTLIGFGLVMVTVLCAYAAVRLMAPAGGGGGGIGVLVALIAIVAGVVAVVAVSARLSVAYVVLALEPVGPLHALRRSWQLTGDNTWRAFGLSLIVLFVVGVFGALINTITLLILEGLADPSPAGSTQVVSFLSPPTPLAVVVDAITTLAFAPVLPVMLAALYFDLRVRRDRLELSLDRQ